jgi:hypothetical protein
MGDSNEPRVGIFFFVDDELVILSTPLSEGEDDGDFVNDRRGHPECWPSIAQSLEKTEGTGYGNKSYDFYPRGRCVYSSKNDQFFLYADRCILRDTNLVERLITTLNLPQDKVIKDRDFHYKCAQCNPHYVPDDVGL